MPGRRPHIRRRPVWLGLWPRGLDWSQPAEVASQACTVVVPKMGLIANMPATMEVIVQPSVNAAAISPWLTRRGPQSPGCQSLKHIR
jgi:hypothetical protein